MSNVMKLVAVIAVLVVGCGMEGPPGPAGPQGPKGDPGKNGSTGAPGPSGSGLVEAWSCMADVTFSWGGQYTVSHAVWKFADGSVMTACEVWGQASGILGMNMWKPGRDATLATCFASSDVEGAGTQGFWTFASLGNSVSQVTYNDPGAPSNGRTFTLPICEVQ